VSAEVQGSAVSSMRRALLALLMTGAGLLGGCSNNSNYFSSLPGLSSAPQAAAVPEATIGTGAVKAALILPLSAAGNAGVAGQAMRNAAEMALSEFNAPNIQLLVKDDAGSAEGARVAAEQALNEGAEIILGPLFAQSVGAVGQVARTRNIPVIAFSTDANVASRGIYLLSFLPESDVGRIVHYAVTSGKRSYAALIPDNPYGTVVEAAFKQDVSRRGGQIVVLERYAHDQAAMAGPAKNVVTVAAKIDSIFIPDGGDAVPEMVASLAASGLTKKVQYLGTGLWDDQRIFGTAALDGGWYAAPDGAGYRNFSTRYTARFKQQPVRTATLAYDAVALIAALAKTQSPQQRFSPEVLTNPSGFSGIDGLFRFRADGTNERGLAVMKVTPTGPQVISPAPKSFTGAG
jgi:branched-chain amino acid transport system substrate-binding protein